MLRWKGGGKGVGVPKSWRTEDCKIREKGRHGESYGDKRLNKKIRNLISKKILFYMSLYLYKFLLLSIVIRISTTNKFLISIENIQLKKKSVPIEWNIYLL